MDLKEVVAVNLRRLRHAKEMTQEELAEKAGLSARYIGAIERAEVSARVTVLGQIADALEVDASELVRALPSRGRKWPARIEDVMNSPCDCIVRTAESKSSFPSRPGAASLH